MARLKDNRDATPSRNLGRWAMRLDHFLFRIDRAETLPGRVTRYTGTTLRGELVTTDFPVSILREEDEEWINAKMESAR